MIAVKKFIIKRQLRNPDDQEMQFKNEVVALMSLRHPNIVRCVGYCFETSKKLVPCNGTFVLAESQQEMLLCLEYLTMGSLDERLQGTVIESFPFFQLLGLFQIMCFVSISTTTITHSINKYHQLLREKTRFEQKLGAFR